MVAKIEEAYLVYSEDFEFKEKEALRMIVLTEDEARRQINKMNYEDVFFDPMEYDRICDRNRIRYLKEGKTMYALWYEKKQIVII